MDIELSQRSISKFRHRELSFLTILQGEITKFRPEFIGT